MWTWCSPGSQAVSLLTFWLPDGNTRFAASNCASVNTAASMNLFFLFVYEYSPLPSLMCEEVDDICLVWRDSLTDTILKTDYAHAIWWNLMKLFFYLQLGN